MRAKDFLLIETQNLFEVNMSPSNLKKLAGQIDAKVGIEFEMLVPDVGSVDDDYDNDPEEDMDYDERVDDIEDICRFFDDREYNVRSDISELRDELNDKFQDWLTDKIREEWDSTEGREFFAKWCRENVSEEDVADQVDTPEDLLGDRIPSKEDWEKFIEEEWESQDRNYDNAFDEFRDEKVDDGDFDENAFLSDIGINYMSDVPSRVRADITWPHWTYPESGGDAEYNLQQVADEFSEAVGMPANYSTSYHGGYRSEGEYDIEPDSSLHGNGDDAGLEFISPPLSLDDALEQIKLVKKWADERGAYTNRSTGLHMNVSVPGFNSDKLDFVKLTLLLGDNYILEKFGRSANSYCKSAMDIIAEAPSAEDKELLFKKLKNNLESIASKVIHSGRVGKFTSINPKDNRVEFRGPGGDWLDQNFNKVEDTLYRCVVALDAAVDPNKYRKEYLKKLTKMFAPTKGSLEDVFVQYQAGTITREELKFKIKTAQAQRKQDKLSKEGIVELDFYNASNGDYIIEYDNPTGDTRRMFLKRTEQVSDPNKAMEAAMKLEPSWFKPDDIENIIVTEFAGNKDYAVLDADGDLISVYRAWTPLQAIDIAMSYNDDLPKNELTVKLASEYQSQPLRMRPDETAFTIINNTLGQEVTLGAVDSATALSRALRNNPSWDSYTHQIRVLSSSPTQPEPGTQYNLYRVRGNGRSQYIAARTTNEAGRIAITAYPEMGDTVAGLTDIVLTDADPNVVQMYLRSQESEIERRNTRVPTRQASVQATVGQPQPAFSNPNEGMDSYIVSDADGSGQVRFRATSPEHAIERARQAYNLPPERELIARLEN